MMNAEKIEDLNIGRLGLFCYVWPVMSVQLDSRLQFNLTNRGLLSWELIASFKETSSYFIPANLKKPSLSKMRFFLVKKEESYFDKSSLWLCKKHEVFN